MAVAAGGAGGKRKEKERREEKKDRQSLSTSRFVSHSDPPPDATNTATDP